MNGQREKDMAPVNGTNLADLINDEERIGQLGTRKETKPRA